MRPLKYNWKHAVNSCQEYWDVKIGKDYLCVYANTWQPNIWIASVNDHVIWNKTTNDRERKREGLPKGCDESMLRKTTLLTSADPEYLKHKVEWCCDHGIYEVSK